MNKRRRKKAVEKLMKGKTLTRNEHLAVLKWMKRTFRMMGKDITGGLWDNGN